MPPCCLVHQAEASAGEVDSAIEVDFDEVSKVSPVRDHPKKSSQASRIIGWLIVIFFVNVVGSASLEAVP